MDSRFSRQTVLPEIGEAGQQRLKKSTAVIVGVGALGSAQAELLCRAGIGRLVLIDFDVVEESNLQRQALYTEADIGQLKVKAAAAHLKSIWKDLAVQAVPGYLDMTNIKLLDDADVVLDGSDNMEVRFLLNEYCVKNNIPVVFSSAVADRGTVLVVDKKSDDANVAADALAADNLACFNCVFAGRHADDDCASAGVLGATTRISASMAANEALKILLKHESMQGLFSFSLNNNRFDMFTAKKQVSCAVCAGTFARLSGKRPFVIRRCRRLGGLRAEPMEARASQEKATELAGKIDGHVFFVDDFGGVLFPALKDADLALRLAQRLV